jgi:hypothetical protein
MSTVVEDRDVQRRVNLILKDSAHGLTSQDLLKISQVAEQAHAAVHISYGSWQVLVGVPESSYELVVEYLQVMGYECSMHAGEIDDLSTFVLNGGPHEASL